MPTYRRSLSNREQRRHEDQLRWFLQAGLDVERFPIEAAPCAVDVAIGYTENFLNAIFVQSIWLVIVTGVRIVARQPRIRLIDEVSVALPWGEEVAFEFLPKVEKTEQYRIAHRDFEEGRVINHQLVDGPLPVGEPREGLLIAQACQAKLPNTYKPGDQVNVSISFIDTLGTEYPAEGTLTMNPSIDTAFKAPRRRSSLFDRDMRVSPDMHHGNNSSLAAAIPKCNLKKNFTGGKSWMAK